MVGQEEQEEDSGGALGIAEMAAALLEEEEKGRDEGDDDPAPTCAAGWTISGSLCHKLQTRTEYYREAKVGTQLDWCPVVTLVTFSSNIFNFELNPKKKH